MEFNQLEVFIQVAKLGSFSKAAEKLYLTQPTISNHIQKLENELDIVLIDRKNKNINLTGAGELLYKYAIELINTRDKAKYSIEEYKGNIKGDLEITTSSIPEQYILPEIIIEFSKLYQNVTFTMNHKDSKAVCTQILDGQINFGIVGARYDNDALEFAPFYDDELVLATPNTPEYDWNKDDHIKLASILNEKFIIRKEGSGTRLWLEEELKRKSCNLNSLNIVATIDSNELVKNMIELGLGISFISKLAIKKEVESNTIKSFRIEDLDLSRKFYFVYSKNRTLSPIAEVFKDFLLNKAT